MPCGTPFPVPSASDGTPASGKYVAKSFAHYDGPVPGNQACIIMSLAATVELDFERGQYVLHDTYFRGVSGPLRLVGAGAGRRVVWDIACVGGAPNPQPKPFLDARFVVNGTTLWFYDNDGATRWELERQP